jgi:hypothetical protein
MLRTGRFRSVALHLALLRRSYGSIPHSFHRTGADFHCPVLLPSQAHERELRLKTRSLLVLIRFGTLKTPQNHPLDTELTVFSTLQRFGFSAVSMEIHLCGDP